MKLLSLMLCAGWLMVAGLADADDAPALDADVGLDDSPVVQDQGLGKRLLS